MLRQQAIGLVRQHDRNAVSAAQERVHEALREAFRPEFLNRIDEVVVFQSLTEPELAQIVELLVAEVGDRLREQGLTLDITPAAKALLVREGYNPAYGARPLRRTVQRQIETPLSRSLLKGEFKPGDTIIVDVANGKLTFDKHELLELGQKRPAEPLGA